jgi:hypothetical protein
MSGGFIWTWELLASIQNNLQLLINASLECKSLTLIHDAPRSEDVWGNGDIHIALFDLSIGTRSKFVVTLITQQLYS